MSTAAGSPAPAALERAGRPRIGMLWGDFPWSEPPPMVGKLWSMGAVARNVTRALTLLGEVVPYSAPPAAASPAAQRAALADFLGSIDVLWADVYPASAPALRLRQELGLACPALVFAGGAMPKAAEAMLFPWQQLLTPSDQLLFTCTADQQIWRRLVRWSRLGEWVIPLAVDDAIFRPRLPELRAATRRRHQLPADGPLLLYVGRLNIQKNLHTVLRLFARVRATVPAAHLCLVGEDDDIVLGEFGVRNTGYVAWLRGLAEELGVAAHVTFAGAQHGEALARLYAAADVLVNAGVYHRENFGMAQAEAQACGLPVVCSAWGGFKEVLASGETGFLMDAVMTKFGIRVDWMAGAQRVVELLTQPALLERIGRQAAAHARQRFSIAALAAALEPIVARCSTEPSRDLVPPAYAPAAFARRYEAHKRHCGWYATQAERQRRWYPAMFGGTDYRLYERMFGPYATLHAAGLPAAAIVGSWIPYLPSAIVLDQVRRTVTTQDPIWPQYQALDALRWAIAQAVDGSACVDDIIRRLAGHSCTPDEVRAGLWQLAVDGIVMFYRG